MDVSFDLNILQELLRRASTVLTKQRAGEAFSGRRPYRCTYLLGSPSQIRCGIDDLTKFQPHISDLYGIKVFQEYNDLIPQNCPIKRVVALVLKSIDICE
jgi:hypothetical protein